LIKIINNYSDVLICEGCAKKFSIFKFSEKIIWQKQKAKVVLLQKGMSLFGW